MPPKPELKPKASPFKLIQKEFSSKVAPTVEIKMSKTLK